MRNITHEYIPAAPPDFVLGIVVLFLVVMGLMSIFSASVPKCINMGVSPLHFTYIQLAGIVIGYCMLRILSNFDYKKLINLTNGFAIFVIAMLLIVHFTGDIINGAQRWINIGPVSIQPSECAKPALVLLLAKVCSKDVDLMDSSKWPSFLLILIMVFFIYKQPNLSMVMLLMATAIVMYLVAGGSGKLIGMGAAFGGVVIALGSALQEYQRMRIKIWLNPEADPLGAGYNIIQSLVAFASGGLWGSGYGASKQKLAWLPEAHTDFIFAVIGEELGFIGCLFLIGLFWTILQRGFIIASKCQNMYGKLLAIGLTFSIVFQAFLNMTVASGMMPATGVPMPFISYGGTSIVVTLSMIGILLNISKTPATVRRMEQYV